MPVFQVCTKDAVSRFHVARFCMWPGAHLPVASSRVDFGVGGCESGIGGSDSRSGSSVSGNPGVCRRHCIAALMKQVFPASCPS